MIASEPRPLKVKISPDIAPADERDAVVDDGLACSSSSGELMPGGCGHAGSPSNKSKQRNAETRKRCTRKKLLGSSEVMN